MCRFPPPSGLERCRNHTANRSPAGLYSISVHPWYRCEMFPGRLYLQITRCDLRDRRRRRVRKSHSWDREGYPPYGRDVPSFYGPPPQSPEAPSGVWPVRNCTGRKRRSSERRNSLTGAGSFLPEVPFFRKTARRQEPPGQPDQSRIHCLRTEVLHRRRPGQDRFLPLKCSSPPPSGESGPETPCCSCGSARDRRALTAVHREYRPASQSVRHWEYRSAPP